MADCKSANPALDCIMTRRSVRSFSDREIDRASLELIAKAACYAPSARNQQKWRFTVIRDREKIAKLAASVAETLGLGCDYNFYKPNAFIICSAPRDYKFGPEDCACALENIFLAAHSFGIGSVWINQLRGICDDANVRPVLRALGLPDENIVFGCAALGYDSGTGDSGRGAVKNLTAIDWA